MKKHKIILIFSLILITIIIGGYFGISYLKNRNQVNTEKIEEYIPEEEINEEQLRQTIVSLYFINKETKEIMPEARLIDASTLIQNPYKTLIELLIQGSKNDKLETIIPKETKVQEVKIEGDCVTLNLSTEFLEGLQEEDKKAKAIDTIVNTLTELTEVNRIKIIIQGEEVPEFNQEYTRK